MADLDRLGALLERFRVRTRLFHAGPLCGVSDYRAEPGRGFLHVLRRGRLDLDWVAGGTRHHATVDRPSLIFFPSPVEHRFHNPPVEGSDFTCATLDIDGGPTHPLLTALPPLVLVPLEATSGDLAPALELLFDEVDRARCGNRVLADRLFEVVLIQLFRELLDRPDHTGAATGLFAGLADERLARVLTAVHERPGADWSLAALAAEAGMSRSAFAAHFRRTVGVTPAAYVTDWRVTLAQARLRNGESVTRVATDLGYATAPAFSRAFSGRVGCSPRAWLHTQRDPVDSSQPPEEPTAMASMAAASSRSRSVTAPVS